MPELPRLEAPPDPPLVRPGRAWWRRAWPVLRVVLGLAAAGVAAYAISGKTEELSGITAYLDHLRWWWLVVAAVAEIGSYLALASLQRRLLRSGGVHIPAGAMLAVTLGAGAIQYTFPGGGVVYLAYLFRQFRRWGADELLAGWVILAFNMVTFSALALLAAAGLAMAFGAGNTYDLVSVILGIVAVAAGFTIVVTERRRLVPHLTRLVNLAQRWLHWPHPGRPAQAVVDGWTAQLAAVSPSPLTWSRGAVMGASNWLADMSCLVLSFYAVGVGVPWRGLLLAYAAGQLAAVLPITPGGLGAVEGSLTLALVTFGGAKESTVAAVFLYRLISFWMILPVGWACWGGLALAGRATAPVDEDVQAEARP